MISTATAFSKRGLLVALSSVLWWCCGCGASAPLLHPARPLEDGEIRGSVGMSRSFTSESMRRVLREARASTPAPGAELNETYVRGLLANAANPPGSSPWVAARVGLGGGVEAGLSYAGRATRLDARHVWGRGPWSFSVGGGVSAIALGSDERPQELRWGARGFGGDLPFMLGWRGVAGLLDVWSAVLISYERVSGDLRVQSQEAAELWTGHVDRWAGGPVVGFMLGIPPVYLQGEVGISRSWLRGGMTAETGTTAERTADLELDAWSVTPSLSISSKF